MALEGILARPVLEHLSLTQRSVSIPFLFGFCLLVICEPELRRTFRPTYLAFASRCRGIPGPKTAPSLEFITFLSFCFGFLGPEGNGSRVCGPNSPIHQGR